MNNIIAKRKDRKAEGQDKVVITEMIIRKAKPTDIDKLYEMGTAEEGFVLSPQTKFYRKDYLRNWVENPKDDILLVVEINSEIVAFAFCRIVRQTWAVLDNILVASSWQRFGIGTDLLNECLNQLSRNGIEYVSGIVKEGNSSINFFLKRKFLQGDKFIWIEKYLKLKDVQNRDRTH